MKRKWLIVHGSLAGMVIAGAIAGALASRPYTSTAVIRVNPQAIPERFAIGEKITVEYIPDLIQTITSRGNLTNVIHLYNLYPSERSRSPLEDVIELMRKAIKISTVDRVSVQISFTYADRLQAQKVTADLVSRIMTEHIRERTTQSVMTTQFLKDSANTAAVTWEESLNKVRVAQKAGLPLDRVQLDAEIARRRYESLSAKVGEAEMSESLERRQQGPTLEVLDPASLPPDSRPFVTYWALSGLLIGAAIGWLISFVQVSWRRPAIAEAS